MKLTDLEPRFIRCEAAGVRRYVDSIKEAHGVYFLCPKCFKANGGKVGTHMVVCLSSSAGAPADALPMPGRWKMEGTGLHDLTLNADPPSTARSVALVGGCAWHGFINAGEVVDA